MSLGLLYTTLSQGEDEIMVPNSMVLSAAVVPLREPAAVDLRARLPGGVKPSSVQDLLEHAVSVPTRSKPHIGLEEVEADEVVVRIAATPESRLRRPAARGRDPGGHQRAHRGRRRASERRRPALAA